MNRPVLIQDLPVAEVDILGAEGGRQTIFANAMLAELLTRELEDNAEAQGAASAVEYDQLLELAAPAGDLLRVAHKLAAAVRLGEWCLERDAGTYDAALSRLLGSILADVIVLRQVELRRRELVEAAEAERRREVLTEARETRTEVVASGARPRGPDRGARGRREGGTGLDLTLPGAGPAAIRGGHDVTSNSGRPSWAAFSFRAPPCRAPVQAHSGPASEHHPVARAASRGAAFLLPEEGPRGATTTKGDAPSRACPRRGPPRPGPS